MKIRSIGSFPITHRDLHGNPLHYLFVRVETDCGVVGYGEVSDGYGCVVPPIQRAVIDAALAPMLIGERLDSVDRLTRRMLGTLRRRPGSHGPVVHAISGIELALWDAMGKSQDKSVGTLIGGSRAHVPVYASGTFLYDGPAEWHMRLFEPCLEQGVRTLKVRTGLDWRADVRCLRGLRRLLGDEIRILVDGTEHYSLPVALEMAREFADLGVVVFEEPIPQECRSAIAALVEKSPVAISYGEHFCLLGDFATALRDRTADVLQPDPATAGGISEVLRVAHLAETCAAPVIPHSAGGPITLAAGLQICGAAQNAVMIEYSFTLDPFWKELVPEPALGPKSVRDGLLVVPDGPGLGLTIDESIFAKYPYRPNVPDPAMPTWSLGNVW